MFLFLECAYSEFCCWCWITHLKIAHGPLHLLSFLMCFLCSTLKFFWLDVLFTTYMSTFSVSVAFHLFLTTLYSLHKESTYSYSLSNVFQPRSTQWSSYCKKMMTPLTRSSWGVWWKALRWMMCMDQWVRYWRDSTSGHILKDRGKTTNVPNWSRVGQ